MKAMMMGLSALIILHASAFANDKEAQTVECKEIQDIKYCETENGRPFSGKYEKKTPGGAFKSIENYKKGYLNGLSTYWDENGKLQERIYFKNGIKNGMDKVYYGNRTIKYLLNYKNGKLDGRMDIYTDDGKLKGRHFYHSGVLQSGFCVDDKGRDVTLTFQQIKELEDNTLETCGVE